MSKTLQVLILVGVYLPLQACFFEEVSSSATGTSFQDDISSMLVTHCATSGCHDLDTSSGGVDLSVADDQTPTDLFQRIENLGLIDVTAPDQSALVLQASNTDPNQAHGGGEIWAPDSPEYTQLLAWIEEGAINDDCTDVLHGFSADVVPSLSTCTGSGCHDGTISPNLIDDPYDAALEYVDAQAPWQSELLQNALGENQHGGGAIFASTNDDDYRTIFCWIQEDGAENN